MVSESKNLDENVNVNQNFRLNNNASLNRRSRIFQIFKHFPSTLNPF
jgi:hypothetical protein